MPITNPKHTTLSALEFERAYCSGRSLDSDDIVRTVPEDVAPQRVWTVVDADGALVLCNGYHVVNFFGYVIADTPWIDNDWSFEVDWEDRDKLVVSGRSFTTARVMCAHDALIASRTGHYDVYELNDPEGCSDDHDLPQVDPNGYDFVAVGSLLGVITVYGPFARTDDLDLVGEASRSEDEEWAIFSIPRNAA